MADGTTDEIKARLGILDVIGGYVRLEKSGAHWKANCPFHQERTPSFMVNEEKNMWHCFGCGKGGDIFAFVMEMEGLEFREALKMLADRAGVDLPQYRGEARSRESKDRTFALLELATKFYEKQLWDGPGKKQALPYLRERGLSDESVRTFRLGYAPDGWRHLLEFLTGKGYAAQEMEQVGLIIRKSGEGSSGAGSHYDRFRDRIMFPIQDILGRVIGYSARVAPGGDETQAKYINTPETPLYHKSRALYGLYLAKQAMKHAGATVVVEGNMDVIAMHQAGIGNTVAVSGTALTDEQLAMMKRYGNEVRLFFDMDEAGQKAARKSAQAALGKEFLVHIIALPVGKDAADMGRDDPVKLRELSEHSLPAMQYFLDRSLGGHDPESAEGKRKIVEEYTELLTAVKNPIERAHWVSALARAIRMEEKLVIGVVNTAFRDYERRERPGVVPARGDGERRRTSFGRRSEMLREELVGLMLADGAVRESLLGRLPEGEVRSFFDKHPLFFFVVQAGMRDPLSLIEESAPKSEAARLVFRVLESPDIATLAGAERSEKMLEMAGRYLSELGIEVTRREKLRSLAAALDEARQKNDHDREKRLLAEFSALSSETIPPA